MILIIMTTNKKLLNEFEIEKLLLDKSIIFNKITALENEIIELKNKIKTIENKLYIGCNHKKDYHYSTHEKYYFCSICGIEL